MLKVLIVDTVPGMQIGCVSLVASFFNGYFAGNPNISFDHIDIFPDDLKDAEYTKLIAAQLDGGYDIIGYSAHSYTEFEQIQHLLKPYGKKVVIGGPTAPRLKALFESDGFSVCDTFGEWYFEDVLGIPRNPNLLEEQKVLLTDTTKKRISKSLHQNMRWQIYFPSGYGCWYNACSYCNYKIHNLAWNFDGAYKMRSDASLNSLITDLSNQLDPNACTIFNTTDCIRGDDLVRLADAFDNRLEWMAYFRSGRYPKGYPPDIFKTCYAKGLRRIFVGVECAHDEGLKVLNKGSTLESIHLSLKDAKEAGLKIDIGYITHIPDFYKVEETFSNFQKYIEPYIDVFCYGRLQIIKGSSMWDKYKHLSPDPAGERNFFLKLDPELEAKNDAMIAEFDKIGARLREKENRERTGSTFKG